MTPQSSPEHPILRASARSFGGGVAALSVWIAASLFPGPLLAAIKSAPTPGQTAVPGASPAEPVPSIEDIAPPVDVFPYPPWIVGCAGLLLLVILLLLLRWWRNRRPTPAPPISPRTAALEALAQLSSQVETATPYAFSIAVSDVVRQFVEASTGVHAVHQTSVEFLESISSRLSRAEQDLLTRFLERCDLIKFAQATASASDSRTLLSSAESFVQGRVP
jgi:hypothetical protein